MPVGEILFLNLDSNGCSNSACEALPAYLRDTAVGGGWCVRTASNVDSSCVPPALVLARFAALEHLPEDLLWIKRSWRQTSTFGLLCNGWSRAGESLSGLLETLDDFILCPFRQIEVIERIRRMFASRAGPLELHRGRRIRDQYHLEFLVGESGCFLDILAKLPHLAESDASVLISGETGTGKELFARAIHYNSRRRDRAFIPVNCGALPDHLLENELFGHARGAYTGAVSTEVGLVTVADGGTLFLDEVDTLSPSAQVKLLRFLQDHEYRPLGSPKSVSADVRIIAATNADLRRKLETGQMREDLYHRLNVLSFHIPALRDRDGDTALLAEHVLRKYGAQYRRPALSFAPGVVGKLTSYGWPGNVRELESVLHRAVVLTEGDILRLADLGLPLPETLAPNASGPMREVKSRRISEFERIYLEEVLAQNGGNVSRAAKAAGKERRTFQRLLRKHGIAPARGQSAAGAAPTPQVQAHPQT